MRSARFALAAIAAGGLIAAGCGDDDGDTTASGAGGVTVPKQEWLADADRICAEAQRETQEAVAQEGITQTSPPDEAQAFTQDFALPTQQRVVDDIRALGLPEGAEEQATAMLDEVQAAIDRVEGDQALESDFIKSEGEFERADALAQEIGLEECGD
jgi:hypothetical protein